MEGSHSPPYSPPPERIERGDNDYMYLPGEMHFAAAGPAMARMGWAVFPQDRDERRRPARIDGTAILWGDYHEAPPTAAEVYRWSIYAGSANTAIILGPPSGNMICLDCDIMDEALSFAVADVAAATLGKSPFQRIGTPPKIALFYRMAAQDLPRYQKYTFSKRDGGASDDAIEVLAKGRSITAEGIHHKTGNYFTWLEANPISSPPELAPLITPAQLDDFFATVERLRPFHARPTGGLEDDGPVAPLDPVDIGRYRIHLPRTQNHLFEELSGQIRDGRKTYLFNLVKSAVVHNHRLASDGRTSHVLVDAILMKAVRELDLNGSAWDVGGDVERNLKREISKQIADRLRAIKEEKLHAAHVGSWGIGGHETGDDTLNYFTDVTVRDAVTLTEPDPKKAAQRKLIVDRKAASGRVAAEIEHGISAFIDDIKSDSRRITILRAPPGSGKTTRSIPMIAADDRILEIIRQRTIDEETGKEAARRGPIVFILPTHSNIDEVLPLARLTYLQPDATYDEIIEAAVDVGMDEQKARDQVDKIRRFAVGRYLNVHRLEGKERAGCMRSDLVTKLQAQGISGSVLCSSKTKVLGAAGKTAYEEKFCEYYNTCPVIAARRQLADADIVFLPRAYITKPLPPELRHASAVIADERIFSEIVGYSTLPIKHLLAGRAAPALTKKEKEAGVDELQLLADREAGVQVVVDALRRREDPADVLYAYTEQRPRTVKTGHDFADAARRVCSTAFTRGQAIDPSAPAAELAARVEEVVRQPTGECIRQEYGFWKTILDRIDRRADIEAAVEEAVMNCAAKPDIVLPERDPRIQYNVDAGGEHVRISHAADINWLDAPWLVLDASADVAIISKLFPGREITEHDVEADANMMTAACVDLEWSLRSLIPARDATPMERLAAAQLIADARAYVSMVAGLHANGRVLVCCARKVRKAIQHKWNAPSNVDFIHFGAVAGLDFGRQHVAMLVLGRSEIPQKAVDGIVGALARNDEHPEQPLDPFGIGTELDGSPLPRTPKVERTLRCRNGADATFLVLQHDGEKAAAVQAQAREEEVRQAIGRLRAVRRTDTTHSYIVGRAIPDEVIIDRIVRIEEMRRRSRFWVAVNRTGGVLDEMLLAKLAPDIDKEAKFATVINKLPKSVKRRYHQLAVSGQPFLVPGHIADPVEYLKHVLRQAGMFRHDEVIEVRSRCGLTVKPAAERPVDKIEEWQSVHQESDAQFVSDFFRAQWRHVTSSKADLLKHFGEYLPTAAAPAEIANVRKTVDVWLAYETVVDEWIGLELDLSGTDGLNEESEDGICRFSRQAVA